MTATELTKRKRPKPQETVIRPARTEEARQIHRLIETHLQEGHLLPRELDELKRHMGRFLVAAKGKRIIACGELAPLSHTLAEIRSLVVDRRHRGFGVGRRLAVELRQQARRDLYDRLCAFTHRPAYFARLGFSIVPPTVIEYPPGYVPGPQDRPAIGTGPPLDPTPRTPQTGE